MVQVWPYVRFLMTIFYLAIFSGCYCILASKSSVNFNLKYTACITEQTALKNKYLWIFSDYSVNNWFKVLCLHGHLCSESQCFQKQTITVFMPTILTQKYEIAAKVKETLFDTSIISITNCLSINGKVVCYSRNWFLGLYVTLSSTNK